MRKILFNLNGKQYLAEVDVGGSVTQDAEILWDERVHGAIRPDFEVGKMELYFQDELILDENGDPVLDEETLEEVYVSVRKLRKKQTVLASHQEKLDQENQAEVNRQARAYLASTDWMVIRQQETGTPVPQEILDARAAARASVVE